MSTTVQNSIFVLTDTPELYGSDLYHENHPTVFLKRVEDLLERLDNSGIAGLVLEIPKVMKASRQNRDRLFEYAGVYPVLRTRPNSRHGFMIYLDPRDVFFVNVNTSVGKRTRNYERITIQLDCLLSREQDPSMAEVLEATIHDISPGGCYLSTSYLIGNERFVNLRVPSLGNCRPIFASVRWSRPDTATGGELGMGLQFIDLTDDQAQKIMTFK